MPIHFMHKSIAFDELVALYAVSDVCLVSSTRDGMNLVSYEYVAAHRERHGVLILSEYTGAASRLEGSIVINPWNTKQTAGAIYEALTMSQKERTERFLKLLDYVHTFTRSVLLP